MDRSRAGLAKARERSMVGGYRTVKEMRDAGEKKSAVPSHIVDARAGTKNMQRDFNMYGVSTYLFSLFEKNSPRESDPSKTRPRRLRL